MLRRPAEDTLWSAPLPLTDLGIGLWEDDGTGGEHSIRGDAVLARMYGLTEAQATQGISFDELRALFHPDDLDRDKAMRQRVRETGGLFVWEHRILPEPNVVRWVLVRGHFARGPNGYVSGRGISIDVTHARGDGEASRFLEARETGGPPIDVIADYTLRVREMLGELDAEGAARLQAPLDALLYEIGRRLAISLRDGQVASEPARERDPKLH